MSPEYKITVKEVGLSIDRRGQINDVQVIDSDGKTWVIPRKSVEVPDDIETVIKKGEHLKIETEEVVRSVEPVNTNVVKNEKEE